MTRISGRFAAVDGFPTDGEITARNVVLRPGGGFVITGEPRSARIRNGDFVFDDIQPGPVNFTISGNGVTHDVKVTVPDRDSVTFVELIETVYKYEPEQVSVVLSAARAAAKSAEDARKAADRVGSASEVMAARNQAVQAADTATGAANSASRDAGLAQNAAQDARGSKVVAGQSATAAREDAEKASRSASQATESANESTAASEQSKNASSEAVAARDDAVNAAGRAETASTNAANSASSAATDAQRAETAREAAVEIAGGNFAPLKHSHEIREVTGLSQELEKKLDKSEGTSNSTPGTWAIRGSQGQIAVGEVPPFGTSATSKKYVDSAVNAKLNNADVSVPADPGSVVRRDGNGAIHAVDGNEDSHVVTNSKLAAEFAKRDDPPAMNPTPSTIVRRDAGGRVNTSDPLNATHAVNKRFFDDAISKRPAFFTGDGPPPNQIPGASVGDVWLDARDSKLYRIEGV